MNSHAKHGGRKLVRLGLLAAAGYYFFASKAATKHRKLAAKWATKLKDEVVKDIKKLEKVDEKHVHAVIAAAKKRYEQLRGIEAPALKQAARELKDNWQELAKDLKRASTKARKTVKKVTKTR